MPNKCAAYGCTTGYDKKKTEDASSTSEEVAATFHFPLKKPDLLAKWTRFVNKQDWKATSVSVLCEKHFKDLLINRGNRNTLKWNLNPIPTIQSPLARKRPSSFPTINEMRKAPKTRHVDQEQMTEFNNNDSIKSLEDIDYIKHCPQGYEGKKNTSSILFYRTVFDETTGFPSISAGIMIDENLHVKLQCNGKPIPLPKWFVTGHNAKLTRFSMLENFPAYISSQAQLHPPSSILEELRQREHYKAKGRPPFSSDLIRYSLLLRYTSPQSYRILLQEFAFPSFSLLKKLNSKGVSSMKAATLLLHDGSISSDVILMADEMYLQKGTQFHGGAYIGANSEGELFSGITVFMIVGLKKSVPIVVRAVPETSINGEYLFFIETSVLKYNNWSPLILIINYNIKFLLL